MYGIEVVCFEAYSASLVAGYYKDIEVDIAGFINLADDYVEHHGSKESYKRAKLKLFDKLLKAGGTVVLNKDDTFSKIIIETCKRKSVNELTYSLIGNQAVISVTQIDFNREKTRVRLAIKGANYQVILPP